MGDACIKLGDNNTALKYFIAAKDKFTEQKNKSGDWQKDIAVLERKIEKLQSKYN